MTVSVEVFWGSGSPFAWRVLLTLEYKRVGYTSHLLEFSNQAQKKPEYLAINPRGKVPTLRHGDVVVRESLAIMAYLDAAYPDPRLFGEMPAQTALIWQSIFDADNYFGRLVDQCVRPVILGRTAEKASEIQDGVKGLRDEFDLMNRTVSVRGWIAGDALSAADIAVYPFVEFSLRVLGRSEVRALGVSFDEFPETYGALDDWRTRMTTLPGYDRVYPPHWRETS